MSFQENLKYYREKAGYKTAKEMADILELPYNTYAGYESKNREPKFELLCKIADLLHISTDELLGHNVKPISEDERLIKDIDNLLSEFEPKYLLDKYDIHKNDITFYIYGDDGRYICSTEIDKHELINLFNLFDKNYKKEKLTDLYVFILLTRIEILINEVTTRITKYQQKIKETTTPNQDDIYNMNINVSTMVDLIDLQNDIRGRYPNVANKYFTK